MLMRARAIGKMNLGNGEAPMLTLTEHAPFRQGREGHLERNVGKLQREAREAKRGFWR
jgi:hypothetical protein